MSTASPAPATEESIAAAVRYVVFAAPERGYAVVAMLAADGRRFTASGPLAHLEEGQRVEVTGSWRTHARHGTQFHVTGARLLDPVSERGVLAYLTRLPGIGERRARALMDEHGESLFARMDDDPEAVLRGVPGLGAARAGAAGAAWRTWRADRDLYVLLASHGLARLVPDLVRRRGDGALAAVRDDPYMLTELHGVGFGSADRIARDLGVAVPPSRRAEAAVCHLLEEAEGQGHAYLPAQELAGRVADLLGEEADMAGPLASLAGRGAVVVDGTRVYRARLHALETGLAAALRDRRGAPPDVPGAGDADLTEEQRRAVGWGLASPLSVVTGGPGTGKSTLTRALVAACARRNLRLGLCAPTGRAARRLSEITGHRADTVHRLLEWRPGGGPGRTALTPLALDVVVVDEASMLTLELASQLVEAVPPGARLVMVGDVDQLPPVGAGRPFADLIESGIVPVTRLRHVFRQSARSLIVRGAHEVNQGRAPTLTVAEHDDVERDLYLLRCDEAAAIPALVTDLVARRLPAAYGLDPVRDIQVLAPMYRGPAGLDALNAALREALCDGAPLPGGRREGEKLIATRNDYEVGLVNGQVVYAAGGDPEDGRLCVRGDDGELWLGAEQARGLRPGYAISVHRAQGSEAPATVVVCHTGSAIMLTRALLYTAITRSRRLCVLVGQARAIETAVRRADVSRRHSALRERLAGDAPAPPGDTAA